MHNADREDDRGAPDSFFKKRGPQTRTAIMVRVT